MARLWPFGKDPEPEPEAQAETPQDCSRCQGTGKIRVVSAKSVKHGGHEPYDTACPDCGTQ